MPRHIGCVIALDARFVCTSMSRTDLISGVQVCWPDLVADVRVRIELRRQTAGRASRE
jgi:hypothetical protein